jgi:riboflavin biosynthesis pyrimidine reductase
LLQDKKDPIPVILDDELQTPLHCKLVNAAQEKHLAWRKKHGYSSQDDGNHAKEVHGATLKNKGIFLVIVTSGGAVRSPNFSKLSSMPGVAIEVCKTVNQNTSGNGHISLSDMFSTLKSKYGFNSVMVEGGGRVISSCLSHEYRPFIDNVIITIAPVFIGKEEGFSPTYVHAPKLTNQGTFKLGDDIIVYGYPDLKSSHKQQIRAML